MLVPQGLSFRCKKDHDNIDSISTFGIHGCAIVVLRDEKGKTSFSHIDHSTNYEEFLEREISWMEGKYTISVFAATKTEDKKIELESRATNNILKYVNSLKDENGNSLKITNHKGKQKLVKLKSKPNGACLVFERDTEEYKSAKDFDQLRELYNLKCHPDGMRLSHEQAIRQFFVENFEKTLPLIMTEESGDIKEGLCGFRLLTDVTITDFLDKSKKLIDENNDNSLKKLCSKYQKYAPEDMNNVEKTKTYEYALPRILKNFFNITYLQAARATTLENPDLDRLR